MSGPRRTALALGCALGLSAAGVGVGPAGAQDRFRLSGFGALQFLADPDVDVGRGAGVGGSVAIRANDNVSFEAGFFFGRSNRNYTEQGEPVEDILAVPAFRYRANRQHLDGSLVYHFGRRQPFQLYLLAGAGAVRRGEFRENFIREEQEPAMEGEDPPPPLISTEVEFDRAVQTFTAHVGAGIEVYIFDNLSARTEYRIWSPREFSYRTQQWVLGVNYYP